MASERLGYWDYVKAAFHAGVKVPLLGDMPLNKMALAVFGVLGLANPGFCNPAGFDYTLYDVSACLAANNPGCGQVGALGEGCTYVNTTLVVDPSGGGDFLTIQAAVDAARETAEARRQTHAPSKVRKGPRRPRRSRSRRVDHQTSTWRD